MRLRLPLPFWLIRRIVRRNPWLLSDYGRVTRGNTLDLGIASVEVDSTFELEPKHKARLLAERGRE